MQPHEPKGYDVPTVIFIVVLVLMFLVAAALVVGELRSEKQPAASLSLKKLTEDARRTAELLQRKQPAPAPKPPPAAQPIPQAGATADPERAYPATTAPAAPQVRPPPADASWNYDVFFGPGWQKSGQLAYQTKLEDKGKLGANMTWTPSGGQPTTWFLGIVEADHPSHANTRFPGFFMHAAYFPQSLVPGSRLLWEYPWPGGDVRKQSQRVRRYDMKVMAWERVVAPAGEFDAARLEGTLQYVDGDSVKAEVRYALWYAPRAKQVVRVRWMGRAPDEGNGEMVAELATLRLP